MIWVSPQTNFPSSSLGTSQSWLLTFPYSPRMCWKVLGCAAWHVWSRKLEANELPWKCLPVFCACITSFLEWVGTKIFHHYKFLQFGNCVSDTICPSGPNPLSLQGSPIRLFALTSAVTPRHTLPACFLPFLLSFFPLLSVWPHHYSP